MNIIGNDIIREILKRLDARSFSRCLRASKLFHVPHIEVLANMYVDFTQYRSLYRLLKGGNLLHLKLALNFRLPKITLTSRKMRKRYNISRKLSHLVVFFTYLVNAIDFSVGCWRDGKYDYLSQCDCCRTRSFQYMNMPTISDIYIL